MPKPRKPENRGLPKGWTFQHGAFYYRVPRGLVHLWDGKKFFRLGETLSEAYETWATRMADQAEKPRNIGEMLDRYALEVIPKKAPATQRREQRDVKNLKAVFEKIPLTAFKPIHAYEYYDRRSKPTFTMDGIRKVKHGGASTARHEIGTLSHAFTKAIRWGCIEAHPFKGQLELEGSQPRTRYIEDWEIVECLSLKPVHKKDCTNAIKAMIKLRLLTGMPKPDVLLLQPDLHFKDDGIHNVRQKTRKKVGKTTIYVWTPELRQAVQEALDARPTQVSTFLFCTRRGQCYWDHKKGEASGWESNWQRFMKRVIKETKVTETFTQHDLRAKCASDAPSLAHAQSLLAHVDARTTNRIYRRKAEVVKPISLNLNSANDTNVIFDTVEKKNMTEVLEKWWLGRDLNTRPRDYDELIISLLYQILSKL
ncbi:tyrosine-type recombinase/integrase [Chitinophaga pinensis]|uniref:Integrase family protein n=1 Tax=Chitinophaga pinensis (strain ATCC 43595 / DSM 2588 / LMG 13176 / NBRC 15968 / NCIMB 11800 / UQM 2034) TaxID=485918 RepID=A0A979GAR8_CHIPD|nr:tyrosine-type recombinase/integrase [Chitinophaga pinensis]ACU63737.1 integrase family protein [Chitinophaga pinensis DSM 2588]